MFWISCADLYGRNALIMSYIQQPGTLGTVGTGLKRHEFGLAHRVEQTWNTGNSPQNTYLEGTDPAHSFCAGNLRVPQTVGQSLYSSKPLRAIRPSETQLAAHHREPDSDEFSNPIGERDRGAWFLKETGDQLVAWFFSLPQ